MKTLKAFPIPEVCIDIDAAFDTEIFAALECECNDRTNYFQSPISLHGMAKQRANTIIFNILLLFKVFIST